MRTEARPISPEVTEAGTRVQACIISSDSTTHVWWAEPRAGQIS